MNVFGGRKLLFVFDVCVSAHERMSIGSVAVACPADVSIEGPREEALRVARELWSARATLGAHRLAVDASGKDEIIATLEDVVLAADDYMGAK